MPRIPRPKPWLKQPVADKLNIDPKLRRVIAENAQDDEGGEGGAGSAAPPFDPEELYQVFLRIHEQHRGLKAPPRHDYKDAPMDPDLAALQQRDLHPLQESAYFSGMTDNNKETAIPSENTAPNARNEYVLQMRKRLEQAKQMQLNPTFKPY